MKKNCIKIGILGFGTIGTGVVKVISNNNDLMRERLGFGIEIVKIADLDTRRDRGIRLKDGILTDDAMEVINNPEIDIIVELIGGYSPAKEFILSAISKGKHIVTANKALLAAHGEEIYREVNKAGLDIGFEASVGGGIPIIKALKEGIASNNIISIYGIINGTCNYILTKMTKEEREFSDVLDEAKRLGYAEADPTFDIQGIDSAHKLAILAALSFGTRIDLKDIYTEGITGITPLDIEYADEFGYKIKLLAIAKMVDGEIEARVHPTMVPKHYLISTVDGVFNAIYIVGDALDETLFYGKGAGEMPTASAVVSDIMDIARNIRKGACGRVSPTSYQEEYRKDIRIKRIEEVNSLYYLRFMALDTPGVLSKISGALGKYNISISRVLQKGRKKGGNVPVVIMTHRAYEKDIKSALAEINSMPYVSEKTVLIRIEGEKE